MKSQPCPHCGDPVEFEFDHGGLEVLRMFSKIIPVCDNCSKTQIERLSKELKASRWAEAWRKRLPDEYARAEQRKVRESFLEAMQWSSEKTPRGMGLIGSSGAGKSCAMACFLRIRKTPFLWWSGTEAREAAIEAATSKNDREHAVKTWEYASRVKFLVIDDISQARINDVWSSHLFNLLEKRNGRQLPTFWTCQISVDAFQAKIINQNDGDVEQAQAIIRRLTQRTLIIGQ